MKLHEKGLSGSLPSTAQMLIETQKFTADLRVCELRTLSTGLLTHEADGIRRLAKLLGEVASEHEALAAELFRLKTGAAK